jgi:hypothetical protein
MEETFIKRVYNTGTGVDLVELSDGTCLTISESYINLCVNCHDLERAEGAEVIGKIDRPHREHAPHQPRA